MKKIFAIVLFSIMSTQGAFAAKFVKLAKLNSSKLEIVAKTFEREIKDEGMVLLNCSSVARLKVLKNADEANLNTMKQLSIIRGGLDHKEGETVKLLFNAKKAVKKLIMMTNLEGDTEYRDFQDEDEQNYVEDFISSFGDLMEKAISSGIQLYYGVHSFDNGGWGLLQVYDTKNQEVLVLKAGHCWD